ncbi:MAG TPA: hypothetical protein VJ963_10945 [Bacteroidales bacterium]|nr:hypothetical protein [Bacteroidales bacterium]
MKSKVKTMGLLLGIMLAGSLMVQGQNAGVQPFYRNRAFNRIPDLTDKQKTELTALSQKHWVKMDTLRARMFRTTNIQKRGDIARDIQIEKDTHRQDVLNLLTDNQKEAFNANGRGMRGPLYGQYGRRGQGMGPGTGRDMKPGRGIGPGRGDYGMRGHRRGMGPGMNRGNCPMWQDGGRGTWQ